MVSVIIAEPDDNERIVIHARNGVRDVAIAFLGADVRVPPDVLLQVGGDTPLLSAFLRGASGCSGVRAL